MSKTASAASVTSADAALLSKEDVELFDRLMKQPHTIVSSGDGLRARFDDHQLADLMTAHRRSRGHKDAKPLYAFEPNKVSTTVVADEHQLIHPRVNSLTQKIPTLVERRSGNSFNSPPVKLYVSDRQVSFTLTDQLPITVIREGTELKIVPQVSTPHHAVYNLIDWNRRLTENCLEIENVYFLHDHFGGNNYAHWLMDWLPRLHFLKDVPWKKEQTRFVMPMPLNRAQRECIHRLGLEFHQFLRLHRNSLTIPITFVSNSIAACSTVGPDLRRPAQYCAPWAVDFVRSLFMPAGRSPQTRKLVIGRKGTRQVKFSPRAQALLDAKGFESVLLEDLTIARQAELFSSASVIVSAHGAALSNLMFCVPKTRVLEIFPEDYSTGNFFSLATGLDLDYTCAVGRTLKVEGAKHIRDHDIGVDEELLKAFLK